MGGSTMPDPYTFARHASRCAAAAHAGTPLVQFVQLRLSGTTACARIAGCWTTPEGSDLWTLDLIAPFCGRTSYPIHKTTQCSGLDDRCFCAGEVEAAHRAKLAPHEGAAKASEESHV